jgi:alditol oxidase
MMDDVKHIKVAGTKHSFNDIADTDGVHISLKNFKSVEFHGNSVTFGAGWTYSDLIEELKKQKLALHNVPSLPHLNVVGSFMTGTHGGGANL